jgi:murein L,D-transpeptidase YcbB/YkuD
LLVPEIHKKPLRLRCLLSSLTLVVLLFAACGNHKHVGEKEVVADPVDIDAASADIIEATLEDERDSNWHLKGFTLYNPAAVEYFYEQADYKPLWSSKGIFTPAADSLISFISASRAYGLFPEDYHLNRLQDLQQQVTDTTTENALDAAKWAESDLLFTSAFIRIVKDVKRGRLIADSVLQKDTSLSPEFYYRQWTAAGPNIRKGIEMLEPTLPAYKALKEALAGFLDTATIKRFTYIAPKDSMRLKASLVKRLSEEDSITFSNTQPDSATLADAIKKYQSANGLKQTGKISTGLVNGLNTTDWYKFARIAVTLDKYKQLPPLPQQYIWVNIPSYQLQLWDSGYVMLTSKVVVGKPQTRTPQLTSAISDLITYPKWHIPQSIIKKEILPALKLDPAYLSRKGFSLVDGKGNDIDPFTVEWAKFENYIPYTVVQGSGDDNALGVIKFNFPNKYSVYLHDTNQRYLFGKEKRALSHGCVRVESWQELATYILERDSTSANAVPVDSMQTWLALKEKHVIPVRKRLPLFIRYFSVTAEEGKLRFYDDVYEEDQKLINLFFKPK